MQYLIDKCNSTKRKRQSLGPHCAYFRMRTLKPQVAKVSTVRVEKISRITDATVDAFATCGFNFRMRKYAQCGPRLKDEYIYNCNCDNIDYDCHV